MIEKMKINCVLEVMVASTLTIFFRLKIGTSKERRPFLITASPGKTTDLGWTRRKRQIHSQSRSPPEFWKAKAGTRLSVFPEMGSCSVVVTAMPARPMETAVPKESGSGDKNWKTCHRHVDTHVVCQHMGSMALGPRQPVTMWACFIGLVLNRRFQLEFLLYFIIVFMCTVFHSHRLCMNVLIHLECHPQNLLAEFWVLLVGEKQYFDVVFLFFYFNSHPHSPLLWQP